MKNRKYISNSVEETRRIAKKFIEQINTGVVIALSGDLGVGKTAFTKGIAEGLEIYEPITSPTFTLLKEYEGRLNLKHIDAYRLENLSSDTLALYDLIDQSNVVVLEWAQYLEDSGVVFDYIITIDYLGENEREISIEEVK